MIKKKRNDEVRGLLRAIEGMLEILLLSYVYYIFWRNSYPDGLFPAFYFKGKYVLAGVYGLLVLFVFVNSDSFLFGQQKSTDITISQIIGLLVVNVLTYFQLCLIANGLISPLPMLYLMVADLLIAPLLVAVYSEIYHAIYPPYNMILIYGTNNAVKIKIKMENRKDKYRITKLLSIEEGFDKVCKEILKYDAVILNDLPAHIRNSILKFCYKNNIRTYAVPKISDIIFHGGKDVNLFDTPLVLMKNRKNGIPLEQRIIKRTMDILISLLALIILSPFMLLVAIAIKIEDGGPVFFRQNRATINGKVFSILKFRSMIVDAEKEGFSIPATGKDPRITKVGSFIRATRLDEIPQIINILKGDMSIVGPRPERVEHVEKYSKEIPEFEYRLKVKGGLTGFAQIYGKYNTSPYDKLRLDLMYIEKYSLLLDIKLIFMTLRILLKKESTEGFEKIEEYDNLTKEVLEDIQNTQ